MFSEVQDEAFRPLKHPEEPWENPGGEERTPPGPRTNRTGGGWTLTRPPDYEVPPVGGPPPSSVVFAQACGGVVSRRVSGVEVLALLVMYSTALFTDSTFLLHWFI